MGYISRNDRRPFEGASKASHQHIINDPEVRALMDRIYKPDKNSGITAADLVVDFEPPDKNPIQFVIAVDGGYTESMIEMNFPSRTIHFMQFGALFFEQKELECIDASPFIAPEDMAKLKNIERLKLALPTKNICFKDQPSLKASVLRAIYEFFKNNTMDEGNSLLDTLAWFVFRRYKPPAQQTQQDGKWNLATNPRSPDLNQVTLKLEEMDSEFTFPCPETGERIYLTDIFRLHEVIEEEIGAGGIMGYLTNVIEHLIIIHIIRQLLKRQPEMLRRLFFIKDGSAGFFGQTARLHEPMLDLMNWLMNKHGIFLAALEKSGAFVEHAQEIQPKLNPGCALVLTDEYIYNHILPGPGDPSRPYASTSNYGHKVIFKTRKGQMHVLSVPVRGLQKSPSPEDLPNLQIILANVEGLHCDMYDSALFPVALVNKLVSLSAHPSQRILNKFASQAIG
ncbi:NurA domain-containing protein [Alkalinema sp. FACHB-956]|uniref:NurA domain-containing protein n=1 Tax=Alkalinema sp. FACHB-956 TaxID=2692768 RepID=UPI001684A3F6|nr:NurA domain-containing protein [Alkalinema sp. FACHB-956]MBD2327250.1 NurA domain-containing protein [Alkalinema sp. FACHB-956]